MFPERLQGAEGPAKTLANQGAGGVRSLGPGDGALFVGDAPAKTPNGNGKVRIFGNRVGGNATTGFNSLLAPGAERAGYDRDAVQQIEGALLHVLAGDVFESLPASEPARTISDFDVASDRSDFRIGKMTDQAAYGVGLDFGIGVDGNDDFALRPCHRVVQRSGFAAVDLMNDLNARLGAEVAVEQGGGAVARAIVHHDDVHVGIIRRENRSHRLYDNR